MPRAWLVIRAHSKSEQGFSVVEVLLAAAVFGFLVTGLIGAIVYGRASSAGTGDRIRANFLAEEGIEASRNIAAASYANLVDGSYGLAQTGNQWVFSGTSDTSGIYTRQVAIAAAGTNRKSVTSTVTWPQSGGTTGNVTLTTRLVNWAAATKVWSNGILAGSADATGTANAIKTDTVGNYAYTVLSAATNNFVITNISTPTAPTNTATISLAGTPTNIFVSGNYAYVTTISDTAELIIVNITNPAVPTVAGSYNAAGAGNGSGVYVIGTTVYVSRAANGGTAEFVIINASNPAAPTLIGAFGRNLAMNEAYVSGNFAYVSTNSTTQELVVINITNPAAPTLGATLNLATSTNSLTLMGYGTILLLGSGATLYAINVATPTAPASLGTFTAAGVINDVDVDITNKFAFLGTASTTAEFQVVNIPGPTPITLARTVDVSGTTNAMGGVSYNNTYDLVVGASASDTREVIVFTRN